MTCRIVGIALLTAMLVTSISAGQTAGQTVPLYGTVEIVLTSNASYNGEAGEPNPFDLDVTAQVVSPSGRRFTVPGFFDGDGQGGAVGRVFKVRVCPDEPGTWKWTIADGTSGVPGLSGRSGELSVSGRLPGFFGKGPIVDDPARPRFFRQQKGGPVFLTGKFLDVAAPSPIQYSHTLLSEKLSDADREAMLRRHLDLKLNKINVYLANRGDYGGVSTTPWVGTAAANDKRRFDLGRWRSYDRWVERIRDSGMVAQLWFFADDSGFGDLPDADRRRLMRYGMARLSGYVNTMFTLALEWQEGWSVEEVHASGDFLQRNNPWARLVSVHGVTGDFAFPAASWVDYLDLQAGNSADLQAVHALGLANRARAGKPLLQEEHGLGEENAENRRKAWAAFTAGAAGVGTGAFLEHLAKFASLVDFSRMEPADGLVTAGRGYALADRGRDYAVYLYGGTGVRVNLRGAAGSFKVEWYDPRKGVFQPAPPVEGGRIRIFNAPSQDDWVLYIHK
ncbi:MAG TPA: DUF5060 domain-containing protein [Thermoanaerobaculia bacterium]|jgi:hypothetical protein|nr:DUF5060 domain-containing protein [Thermoanaerobaculia bacterium]